MASLSQLIVKISADASGFEKTVSGLQKSAATMAEKFEQAGSVLTRAVSLPLGLLGGAALKSAADFEGLRRGLEAVTGSAAKAEAQFQSLKKVAELPGLGFREAVQGSINLQAAGFSAGTAERALKAFGNALATVGKGRAELDGVVLALSQIQSKGKFSAEELNQLAERLPQIRVAIKAAFGTADTEEIQKLGLTSEQIITKIIEQFERLPQASGGLKNAFENLKDSLERTAAAFGDLLSPGAQSASEFIVKFAEGAERAAAAAKQLPQPIKDTAVGLTAVAASAGLVATAISGFSRLAVVVGRVAAAISGPFGIATTVLLANIGNITARFRELRYEFENDNFLKALTARFPEMSTATGQVASDLRFFAQQTDDTARAALNLSFSQATANDKIREAAKVVGDTTAVYTIFKAISFADKSKDNELFAASIGRIGQESDRLKKEIGTLQDQIDNGPKFDELVGPNIELGVSAFARLIPHAKEFNTDLLTAGERTAKFVDGLAKIEAQSALTADALQNIKIPQVLQDVQEQIKKTTSKFKTPELSAFGREVQRIGSMMSNTIADTIVRAESLGAAFAKIGQEIAATILTYAINQGIKLLISSLDGLIGKLGSVGRAIQGAFGGVAGNAGGVAGAAGSAGSTAAGIAGSAGAIAAGGLASTVTAVSGVATAVFAALQFLQGRRMEQDIGRIEVTSRGQLNQLVSIQETMNTYLPNLLNTQYLSSINEGIRQIYQGLSQVDFSGIRGDGAVTIGTINVTGGATAQDGERVAEAITRTLRLRSRAFATP